MPYPILNRKTVLITGASSGIGLACSRFLASRGFRVFAGVRRADSFADLATLNQPNLTPVRLDVTDSSSIQAAREFILGETGNQGLDGLINNAGGVLSSPVEFLDLDQYRQLLEVNLIGAIAVCQAMMEMLRTAQGRIINVSSVSGLDSAPFLAPYASSKFALEAFSDSLRVELAIWKIKVILIEPGDVATPLFEKYNQELLSYNQKLPQRAWELYGPVFEWEKEIKTRGMPSQVVAEVIEKALVTTRPKARYMLGPEARIVRFLRAVPTPMRDWILLHRLP
jgi:NAD(P)-dependent dehydrogenase (short-subunit alcohol dehydrogenase family)